MPDIDYIILKCNSHDIHAKIPCTLYIGYLCIKKLTKLAFFFPLPFAFAVRLSIKLFLPAKIPKPIGWNSNRWQ